MEQTSLNKEEVQLKNLEEPQRIRKKNSFFLELKFLCKIELK